MKTLCPHCNRSNRVSPGESPSELHCNYCHKRLIPAKPLVLDDESLKKITKQDQLPIVIEFWAPGCGPCKQMSRIFEVAARETEASLRFAKLNTSEYPKTADRYKIRSVPTLLILKSGRETARSTGALNQSQLYGWINKNLSS